jgi:hypothetical protein
MATRLLNLMEKRVRQLNISYQKGWTFQDLQLEHEKYQLTFIDQNKNAQTLKTKFVVFATGSLFPSGSLIKMDIMEKIFTQINIPIPNPLTHEFELHGDGNNPSPESHLFVCGSALFPFHGGLSDEEEIRNFTGLGLAICSSAKVAAGIVREFNKR